MDETDKHLKMMVRGVRGEKDTGREGGRQEREREREGEREGEGGKEGRREEEGGRGRVTHSPGLSSC